MTWKEQRLPSQGVVKDSLQKNLHLDHAGENSI